MTPAERDQLRRSDRPFGAHRPRAAWPIRLWGVLLAGWFGLLIWMALTQAGR